MKHIGIIGVSAEGAGLCFQTICSESAKATKSFQHPEISLHELSSQLYFDAQPKWDEVAMLLLFSAVNLADAGADFAIIPSNTMHFALEKLRERSPIPVLSLVEAVVDECVAKGFKNVGVLGTKLTVGGGLYNAVLAKVGIDVVIPSDAEQERTNRIIFEEIVPGKTTPKTVKSVIELIQSLKERGAEVVILGCTELPIVVNDSNSPLPTIDTTRLLAKVALKYATE